jgi:hypothetical protein
MLVEKRGHVTRFVIFDGLDHSLLARFPSGASSVVVERCSWFEESELKPPIKPCPSNFASIHPTLKYASYKFILSDTDLEQNIVSVMVDDDWQVIYHLLQIHPTSIETCAAMEKEVRWWKNGNQFECIHCRRSVVDDPADMVCNEGRRHLRVWR